MARAVTPETVDPLMLYILMIQTSALFMGAVLPVLQERPDLVAQKVILLLLPLIILMMDIEERRVFREIPESTLPLRQPALLTQILKFRM